MSPHHIPPSVGSGCSSPNPLRHPGGATEDASPREALAVPHCFLSAPKNEGAFPSFQAKMDNEVLGYKDLAAIPKDKAILDIERPDLMIYEPHFTYSLMEHVELPRSREVRVPRGHLHPLVVLGGPVGESPPLERGVPEGRCGAARINCFLPSAALPVSQIHLSSSISGGEYRRRLPQLWDARRGSEEEGGDAELPGSRCSPAPLAHRSSGNGWRAGPPAVPRSPPLARAAARPAAVYSTSTDPVRSPSIVTPPPQCRLTLSPSADQGVWASTLPEP